MASQDERKAETRQRLLDAAADLFATKGVHATSLDAVAEAADRTTGAIYAHFGGKAGLLLALVQDTSREVGRTTRKALDAAPSDDDRLGVLWSTFAARAEAPGDEWMLLEHELWLHAARTPEVRDQLAQRFGATRRLMGRSYPDGEGDPPLRSTDRATLVLALLFGLEMQRRVDPAAVPDDLAVAGLRLLVDPADPPTD